MSRAHDKYAFAEQHPHPGDDPVARLRHTVELFEAQPDDEFAVMATSNASPDGGRTGLTWGDRRERLNRLS